MTKPASIISSATLEIIALIEEEVGSKAKEFDDVQSDLVLDTLTDLEASLDPISDEEAIRKAASFLSGT